MKTTGIENMSEDMLKEKKDELVKLLDDGEITFDQALSLKEIRDALKQIDAIRYDKICKME